MKKSSAIAVPVNDNPDRLRNHDHIHAANCGHRSLVHGDHIDYLHEDHYHYVKDGMTFKCDGPNSAPSRSATILPFVASKGKSKK